MLQGHQLAHQTREVLAAAFQRALGDGALDFLAA
jgi:hypothetical protein